MWKEDEEKEKANWVIKKHPFPFFLGEEHLPSFTKYNSSTAV